MSEQSPSYLPFAFQRFDNPLSCVPHVIRVRHLDLVRTVHAQVPASRRKISP